MSRPKISQPYTIVKIPNELSDQIYEYKKKSKDGFATITEIVKIAIRDFLKNNSNGGCSNISPMGNNGDGDEENKAIVYKNKTKRGKHEKLQNDRNRKSGGSSETTPPA